MEKKKCGKNRDLIGGTVQAFTWKGLSKKPENPSLDSQCPCQDSAWHFFGLWVSVFSDTFV